MVFQKDKLHPQLRRAMLYLEDELWEKAWEACERVLDQEPENACAYVLELMAQLRLHTVEELCGYSKSIRENGLFRKAMQFADSELVQVLTDCADAIDTRLEQEHQRAKQAEQQRFYDRATKLMKADATEQELAEAERLLAKIAEYRDVLEEWKSCCERLEKLRVENAAIKAAEKKKNTTLFAIAATGLTVLIVIMCMVIGGSNAKRAARIEAHLPGMVFEGTADRYNVPDDPNPIGENVRWEYRYVFVDEDTVEATITYTLDCGSKTIWFGDKMKYYSSGVRDYTYQVGDVHISYSGDVTLHIGGKAFDVVVEDDDMPTKLVSDDVTLKKSN